ncbi:MAG: phosphotransferase family protein [Bacteroidota bacterium]
MSANLIDKAGKVRKGEELDPQRIGAYLKDQLSDIGELTGVAQFKGGASNLTYQLDFEQKSYILRRPPAGTKAKSAHNMQREFDIMKRLKPHYPYVPAMLLFCEDESIIGSDFYVMEKLVGMIPRANLPKDLNLSAQDVRQMCEAAIDKLVELHQIDYQAANFERYYKGIGYVERQIKGWSKRYRRAKTPNVPDFEVVMEWLAAEMPADKKACIIHNDFRFDNLVYDVENPTVVTGVLDWEMATVGDPLMDLGGSLAYWIEATDPYCWRLLRRQPTQVKGMMSRDEVVDYYLDKMGWSGLNMKYYYIFGIFRLAVIIQQIYYRYYHKQTTNPQFKIFAIAVDMLETYCRKMIRSKNSQLSQYPLNVLDNAQFSLRFLWKQLFG